MNKRITISAMVIALYLVLIYVLQGVSFGAIQIRMANSLYALCALYPFLVLPLGIAVVLANLLFGGLGMMDILCGFIVTTVTCYIVSKLKRSWLIALPIILIPGLLVPIWLSMLLKIPYIVLMPSVLLGQVIPALTGVMIVKKLKFSITLA